MDVNFKFNLSDKVKTPVSMDTGIITMLAIDEGGIQYYIVTQFTSNWWSESKVTKA